MVSLGSRFSLLAALSIHIPNIYPSCFVPLELKLEIVKLDISQHPNFFIRPSFGFQSYHKYAQLHSN